MRADLERESKINFSHPPNRNFVEPKSHLSLRKIKFIFGSEVGVKRELAKHQIDQSRQRSPPIRESSAATMRTRRAKTSEKMQKA
jgi:hypothetical protein